MTPPECVKVFSASSSRVTSGCSDREKLWSHRVIVVVLTVMRPGRLSCKSMVKAVVLTAILTIVSGFFLLSFAPQLSTGISDGTASDNYHVPRRRKLRLTAKDGHSINVKAPLRLGKDPGDVWDIKVFKSYNDIQPYCEENAILLIMITSAPGNYERRNAIRKSWCSSHTMGFSAQQWQCVFMIGQTENSTISTHITQEAFRFRDILQGSYLDVYRNLTLKVFHGFDWAAKNCHQVQYLLKTDDDCFVNAGLLYNFLVNHNHNLLNLYVGNVFSAEDKRTVVRNPKSRWFVSEQDFAETIYPRYSSGTGYLMSYDVLLRLVQVSKSVTPFPVEDAYVGYLIYKLGIEPIASTRFTLYGKGWTTCNFLYLMVIHGVEADTQSKMLSKTLSAPYSHCKVDGLESSWR
ncbi:beta-1,3-galactosyltransferase 5-like [Liolophura sinensis]|uniref:beta-1,3-galactosyltransferase 5-like n=1 Tax=Liolophura sinensis TaxID=3198878 RepID=UPI0031593777